MPGEFVAPLLTLRAVAALLQRCLASKAGSARTRYAVSQLTTSIQIKRAALLGQPFLFVFGGDGGVMQSSRNLLIL